MLPRITESKVRLRRSLMGIDIGGTKCAVVVGTSDGRVAAREEFATEVVRGPDHAVARLMDCAERLWDKAGDEGEPLVGISCGGPLDSGRGVVLSPPNLPGWDRIPIVDLAVKRLGGRAALMNDANAGALAEWTWGAARGTRDAVFLTFGTGLGAGIILGGRLHSGADDLAGEVGHVRLAEDGPEGFGKRGSFEGFCSGGGLERLARARAVRAIAGGDRPLFCGSLAEADKITLAGVADAARRGDPLAREIFDTGARYLGRGLAMLVDVLNPEVICIGGVYGRCEDLLREGAARELVREAIPASARRCRVTPAALGERIGDMAALAVARAAMDTESF